MVAVLTAVGCSGGDGSAGSGTTDFPARTLASTPGPATTTKTTQTPGITTGGPEVVLRIEGAAGTEFSGVCTTGPEDSVLVGRVPKTYNFDLRGQPLSCRIEKQSPGAGSLRTVLLAGDNTRSIQQTESQNSTINISYSGG